MKSYMARDGVFGRPQSENAWSLTDYVPGNRVSSCPQTETVREANLPTFRTRTRQVLEGYFT